MAERQQELAAGEAAEAALDHITRLTTSRAIAATSAEPTDDGWTVEVEVLEERRIPSSSDMLALYEIELDAGGDLLAYRRTRRYARGRSEPASGGS